jgi:hypothetical protein
MWDSNQPQSTKAARNPLLSAALAAFVVGCAAVAYYFAVSLPNYNNARLALERQKYSDEQKQRAEDAKKAVEREDARTVSLTLCLNAADRERIQYLKLNGTTTAEGTIKTEDRIVRFADEKKKTADDSCFKQYGR